jgi:transcriptional regulator with GAF, ATPase, and Fis domain
MERREFLKQSVVSTFAMSAASQVSTRTLPSIVDLHELLTAFERGLIERAMKQANGVQAEAARMLGLSRSDMGYKVAKYAMGRPVDAT